MIYGHLLDILCIFFTLIFFDATTLSIPYFILTDGTLLSKSDNPFLAKNLMEAKSDKLCTE